MLTDPLSTGLLPGAYAFPMGMVKQYDLASMGGRIACAVEDSGKTQTQIAAEIGCTHSAVSQWKSGATGEITARLLQAFADSTGVEIRWLITGEEPVRSRYMLTQEMQRLQDAVSVIARESPIEMETVVRMVEAAAKRHHPPAE